MFLSVIIPAYNEEKRIVRTIEDSHEYLKTQNYEYEIIVVNDGSNDGTSKIVGDLSRAYPRVRLINLENNKGKGFAVKEGMRLSRGQFKLFMDADNSTTIANVDRFLPYLQKDIYDIVISSRQRPDSRILVEQPKARRFLGGVWRLVVKMIVPLALSDSQNGFKLFRREAANFLFSKQTIERWAFDVEILALARKFNFNIKEVGVEWKNDSDSRLSLVGMVHMLSELIQIRTNLWKKRYD
ncbi:MAG: dolichyl-phosphate beta-glucosyltransferase [Candidatus Taylorbacteria bacterium]